LDGGKKKKKKKKRVGWGGGGWGAKHSLFCCMIARMPLGGAISPKKSHARTHTHTPPVGLSPPIQHIITVAKLRTGIHSLRG